MTARPVADFRMSEPSPRVDHVHRWVCGVPEAPPKYRRRQTTPGPFPYRYEELGSQRPIRLTALQQPEHTVEGRRGGHRGKVSLHRETDGRVVVRRLPVPRQQECDGVGALALHSPSQSRGEVHVGFPLAHARTRRVGRTRWGRGLHRTYFLPSRRTARANCTSTGKQVPDWCVPTTRQLGDFRVDRHGIPSGTRGSDLRPRASWLTLAHTSHSKQEVRVTKVQNEKNSDVLPTVSAPAFEIAPPSPAELCARTPGWHTQSSSSSTARDAPAEPGTRANWRPSASS